MIFDTIQGHKKAIHFLKTSLASQRMTSRGYIFSGPSGVGKKLAALGLAQSVLCSQPHEGLACAKCPACIKAAKIQHPDLMMIDAGGGNTIKVEAIREIIRFMGLKSFEGRAKVVIIDDAHLMTPQGSNSLLKTLEEPPENSYFILITPKKRSLLSTIQSRCQSVLFGSLSPSELQNILGPLDPEILALCQGRADLASQLQNESFKEVRDLASKAVGALCNPSTSFAEGFQIMGQIGAEKETILQTTQLWGHWTKLAQVPEVAMGASNSSSLSSLRQRNQRRLSLWAEKIFQLENDISANINKILALEKFWIDSKLILNGDM